MKTTPLSPVRTENLVLSVCNFLSKGWEVSILGLLAFLQLRNPNMPFRAGVVVGILSTVFIVTQIGVSFFAGRIAHAMHSRNVVLLAIGASGLAWLTLFLTDRTFGLFVGYALGGVASGLFEPIGNSLVAKRSSANKRGTAIGNFAAFGDMGRIAVVAIANSLAGWFGVRIACGALLLTNIAALIVAQVYMAKPRDSDDRETGGSPIHIKELLKNSRFCYATLAGVTDSFSSSSLYIFIPFLLAAKGIALANTLYFNVIFFAGYMSGRLVLGRLADKFGPATVLMISEVVMATLLVALVLTSASFPIMMLLFVLGIFTRGTSPIIRAMVADSMDDRTVFHDAFAAYSVASRGSTAVCRPIYGYLMAYAGISSVFYLAGAVSLFTLYPAAKYEGTSVFGLAKRGVK